MAWPRQRIWHLNKKRNTRLECSWRCTKDGGKGSVGTSGLRGPTAFQIYLTCKSLEVELKQLILQGGESAAMVQSAVNSVVRILQFTWPGFQWLAREKLMVYGNLKDLHEAPHESTFIKHNGVLGVAGQFISTIDVDQALYRLLGAPVIWEKKTKNTFSRHAFKHQWLNEFPGLRIGRSYCCLFLLQAAPWTPRTCQSFHKWAVAVQSAARLPR